MTRASFVALDHTTWSCLLALNNHTIPYCPRCLRCPRCVRCVRCGRCGRCGRPLLFFLPRHRTVSMVRPICSTKRPMSGDNNPLFSRQLPLYAHLTTMRQLEKKYRKKSPLHYVIFLCLTAYETWNEKSDDTARALERAKTVRTCGCFWHVAAFPCSFSPVRLQWRSVRLVLTRVSRPK